jgi:hypothetical protein
MAETTIRVIRKRVGHPAVLVDIPKTLEAMQEEVSGYIQAVPLFENIVLICNEDGKLVGQTENFPIPWGDMVVGNAFFVRDDGGDDWASLEPEDMRRVCDYLGLAEMGFPV